jgi:hypothetical protein
MSDFITEHFIKIFIGVIAVVVWIIGKIKENQTQKEEQTWEPQEEDYLPGGYQTPEPPPLYQPGGSAPPPLPQFMPADDSELERQRKMQDRLRAIRQKKGATAPKPVTSRSAPRTKPTLISPTLVSPSKLKERLRDRKELRRAIVMNEILNPPISLR